MFRKWASVQHRYYGPVEYILGSDERTERTSSAALFSRSGKFETKVSWGEVTSVFPFSERMRLVFDQANPHNVHTTK